MNMLATIVPKSDQLNADDLIGRTMTITVTKVEIVGGEQPVALSFEDDGGKPYKPGKSMRRVLVKAWGADAKAYAGRALTLYRDDAVRFGGMEVGGIRISHMSHITETLTMALTETKGKRKPFVVHPLAAAKPAKKPTVVERFADRIAALPDRAACATFLDDGTDAKKAFNTLSQADQGKVKDMLSERMADFLAGPSAPPDDGFGDAPFPGDAPAPRAAA